MYNLPFPGYLWYPNHSLEFLCPKATTLSAVKQISEKLTCLCGTKMLKHHNCSSIVQWMYAWFNYNICFWCRCVSFSKTQIEHYTWWDLMKLWVTEWRHFLWWGLAPNSPSFSLSQYAPTFMLTTYPTLYFPLSSSPPPSLSLPPPQPVTSAPHSAAALCSHDAWCLWALFLSTTHHLFYLQPTFLHLSSICLIQ